MSEDKQKPTTVKCPNGHESPVIIDIDATVTLNKMPCPVCGKTIKMLAHRMTPSS
jgi:transcription elongation factor Elf1